MVRARVADLQSIPQWIVYSDGVNNDLDSWTVQCEIVSHDFMGGGPPPEDLVPHHFDHMASFDFFGFCQPGAGPVAVNARPANDQQQARQQNVSSRLGNSR
jgi:hypothetical protein